MPIKAMVESSRRGPYDELNTPYEAIRYLLPHLHSALLIWESAPGNLRLVNMLENCGRNVVWSDKNYFEWQPAKWDVQVTNPPFSVKAKWLKRANELSKPYAILLPVTALGARNCQLELGGIEIILLPRRIDFTGKKAPWFATAWFTKGLHLPSQINIV